MVSLTKAREPTQSAQIPLKPPSGRRMHMHPKDGTDDSHTPAVTPGHSRADGAGPTQLPKHWDTSEQGQPFCPVGQKQWKSLNRPPRAHVPPAASHAV
jgi:hypothetical protein